MLKLITCQLGRGALMPAWISVMLLAGGVQAHASDVPIISAQASEGSASGTGTGRTGPQMALDEPPETFTAPARDPAGTGHAPATQALAEVIVTAEKIAEPIDATPAAITALSMTQLRDAGVFTVPDLASTVPDLQVHTAGADAYFGVTIRGISNLDYSGGANPAVAI